MLGGCSGEFQGVKYFGCAPDHGLFFPVNLLKRDDRFDIETGDTRRRLSQSQLVNTPH